MNFSLNTNFSTEESNLTIIKGNQIINMSPRGMKIKEGNNLIALNDNGVFIENNSYSIRINSKGTFINSSQNIFNHNVSSYNNDNENQFIKTNFYNNGILNREEIYEKEDAIEFGHEEFISMAEEINELNGYDDETFSSTNSEEEMNNFIDKEIELIPIYKYMKKKKNSFNDVCCICFGEFYKGEYMKKLNCNHEFHKKCLDEWLKVKNECPLCKKIGIKIN